MAKNERDLNRPIRVVLFSSGPMLARDVKQFICRLEAHPEIEFLGSLCQSEAQTFGAIVRDLWRRRGGLALPLLIARIGSGIGRFLVQPKAEIDLNRKMARMGDRLHFVPDIHAEKVLMEVDSLKPDLGLIYGSPILKPKLFELPTLGTLGIHHGKVPEYRGKKATFWAMYNGEKTAGVTIQKVDVGLDSGEVVKEGEVCIGRRSLRVVQNEVETLGFDLYIQAIIEVKKGTAAYLPQMGKNRRLYRDPKVSDILRFCWKQVKRRLRLTHTSCLPDGTLQTTAIEQANVNKTECPQCDTNLHARV